MSRYKPFGKSKQHGGGGFQFDKLLKVCSNSKKVATATNTIGSMGRFGMTSFTSTRNSNLDSSGEDDSKLKPKSKRPRLDIQKGGIPLMDPFNFPHIHTQSIPGSLPQENAQLSVPTVFKPRKFFKSRDPVEVTNETMSTPPIAAPLRPFVPPITIPIPTLTLSLHNTSRKASTSKKSHKEKKYGNNKSKHADLSDTNTTLRNSTNVSPTTRVSPPINNNYASSNIVSPSIKLRIFKDKTTSTFVSVSDASPQKPLDVELVQPKVAQRRGRKKKEDIEKLPRKEKAVPEIKPVKATPSGRVTRNSRKHLNSNSSSDTNNPMPILRREDADLGLKTLIDAHDQNVASPSPLPTHDLNERSEKIESAELVKKLEEEDSEFRQLSAMLSSMEEGEEEQSKSQVPSPPPPSQNIPTNFNPVEIEQLQKHFETPKNNLRDIRSMLEDDWDDEEESPRKPNQSPSKVTRFDMSAFGEDLTLSPERRKSSSKSPAPIQVIHTEQEPVHFIPEIPIIPQQPFNAPHAVRNLLSGFTDTTPLVTQAAIDMDNEIGNMSGKHIIDCARQPGSASTKKGSIFKSRSALPSTTGQNTANPTKRLALYKHKFGQESGLENAVAKLPQPPASTYLGYGEEDDGEDDDDGEEAEDLSLRRLRGNDDGGFGNRSGSPNEASKVFCKRKSKRLFTVVRNVKAIHELQESGEVHEFDGDVWYILEDLKDKNPISSRCLSAITLAMRCMEPAFRMHLRAHGTVAEFCKELHDAPTNPMLALLAATVLFVLSQDRLNMDLDTESLQLIIALSKTEESTNLFDENSEIAKHRQRVIDLVSEMKNRGHAEHLKIERITAAELALETLLYLTSKRAGEWVKHELRTLGGLDYITTEVDKYLSCLKTDLIASMGWTDAFHEKLWKVDRCLRVLQQVTFNHEENQRYLLGVHQSSQSQSQTMVATPDCSPAVFVNLFRFFADQLSQLSKDSPTASILRELLFSVLRVLVNLTHDYRGIVLGSEILASEPDFIPLTLHSVFHLSSSFVDDKVFDLLMHSLCMLLNLVEHSRTNRNVILAMTVRTPMYSGNINGEISTLDALIQMFLEREREAKAEEGHTDDILTKSSDAKDAKHSQGSSDSQNNSQEKDSEGSSVQDIIDKLIHTAGRHMENSLIAAYISLLLAYLIMDDPVSAEYVRNAMPNSTYLPLMVFLKKLFNFMSITSSASGSIRGLKATSTALKFYAKHDPGSNEALKKIIPD